MQSRWLLYGFGCVVLLGGCEGTESITTDKGRCDNWSESLQAKIGDIKALAAASDEQRQATLTAACESATEAKQQSSFTTKVRNNCTSVAAEIASVVAADDLRQRSNLAALSYNTQDVVTHAFKGMCYAEAEAAVVFDKKKHVFATSNYAGIQQNPLEFNKMFTGDLAAKQDKILGVIKNALSQDSTTTMQDIINPTQKDALIKQVITPWYQNIYQSHPDASSETLDASVVESTVNTYYDRHKNTPVRQLLNTPDVQSKKVRLGTIEKKASQQGVTRASIMRAWGIKDVTGGDYITPWIKGMQDTVQMDPSVWSFQRFIKLDSKVERNITGAKKDNGVLSMLRLALFDAYIAKQVNDAGLTKDLQAIQKEFFGGPLGDAEKKAQHMARIYQRADVVCTQETDLVVRDLMTKGSTGSKPHYFVASNDTREDKELAGGSLLFFRTSQWKTAQALSFSGVKDVKAKEVSVVLATDTNNQQFVVACAHSLGNGSDSNTIIKRVNELADKEPQAKGVPIVLLADANTNQTEFDTAKNKKKPPKASVSKYLEFGQNLGFSPVWGTQTQAPITVDKQRTWAQLQLNKADVQSTGRSDYIWTKNLRNIVLTSQVAAGPSSVNPTDHWVGFVVLQ